MWSIFEVLLIWLQKARSFHLGATCFVAFYYKPPISYYGFVFSYEWPFVFCRTQEGLALLRLSKNSQYNRLNLNITASYQYNRLTSQYNRLMSLYNRLTETGPQNQQKKNVWMWDHFFPLLFPKDSESLKILDIRLREVGAKRQLNGTSKSEQTDRQTDKRTDISTYRKHRPRGPMLWKLALRYIYIYIHLIYSTIL